MRKNNFELRILVGGRPITEYYHQENTFIEGRKGSEFTVEFKNHTGSKVLVVPSVDAISVFDGQPATPDSRGYVVKPYDTLNIKGWRLDNSNVAKFFFQDKERSYAASTSSDATNAGVIGVLVFKEKEHVQTISNSPSPWPPINPWPVWPRPHNPWPYDPRDPRDPTWINDVKFGSSLTGIQNIASNNADMGQHTKSRMRGAAESAPISVCNVAASGVEPFELGTGFGRKTEFKTSEVSFNKGVLAAEISIFYDSKRNLEKRGIQVVRRERQYLNDLPQAFSGGCKPPPGWSD
jgi:hypothetical protein